MALLGRHSAARTDHATQRGGEDAKSRVTLGNLPNDSVPNQLTPSPSPRLKFTREIEHNVPIHQVDFGLTKRSGNHEFTATMESCLIIHSKDRLQLARDKLLDMSPHEKGNLIDAMLRSDPNQKLLGLLTELLAQREKNDIDATWEVFSYVGNLRQSQPEYPSIDLNPWIDLPLRSPNHDGRQLSNIGNPSFTAPFPLQKLPPELILTVAEFLPFESRAAFALTTRHIHGVVGRLLREPTASPGILETFRVIRLLERDHDDMVACPSCYVLHSPEKQCFIHEMHVDVLGVPEFFHKLPSSLNYNVIRSIAQQRIRDQADRTDACASLLRLLQQSDTIAFTAVKAIASSLAMFVGNGNLVLRTQVLVCPATQKYFTPNSIRFLKDCLQEKCFHLCPHYEPNDLIGRSGFIWGEWGWRLGWKAEDHERWALRRGDRAFDCPAGDIQETNLDRNLHPALQMILQQPETGYFGRCDMCATEFGITLQDVPSVGPSFCMTVWKDLGGPCNGDRYSEESMRRFKWDTHCLTPASHWYLNRNLAERLRRAACLPKGFVAGPPSHDSIANAFETLFSDPTDGRPQVEQATRPFVEPMIMEKMAGLREKESISRDEYWGFFKTYPDQFDS